MTPSDARDTVLARIRSSIQQSRHGYHPPTDEVKREYRCFGNLSPTDRNHLFIERLREYDARVIVTDAANVAACINGVMSGSGIDCAPADAPCPWVVADGFPPHWFTDANSFLMEKNASVDDLNRCAGILTTCTVGIAMTGSIVLHHGAGEGRRQSTLLPDRHLCVIQASQVVETVPEAFDRLAALSTRPLTFISGPSATADIEMTRIRGVHGPRLMDIVLIRT